MKFSIQKSELGFASDLLAGAETPASLLAIGEFVHAVSAHVSSYQKQLDELVDSQKNAMESLAKEYFESNENGDPRVTTVKVEGQADREEWVLLPGKTREEFQEKYTALTNESMKTRADVGLEKIEIDVEEKVFTAFLDAIKNGIKISDVIRNLGVDQRQRQEFTAVLYSVIKSFDSIQA